MSRTIAIGKGGRSESRALVDWLPLVAATTIVTFISAHLPDWARMWLLTISLYGGFKCLTWQRAVRRLPSRPPTRRSVAYLFLWPGMDAGRFLSANPFRKPPARSEWLRAVRNIAAGAAILCLVAGHVVPWRPWLIGWAGLVGIGLGLHFGVFYLLSLAWQRVGVDARPIMQRPAAATSLADFWGRRWNTAFRDLAHQLVYRPLARSWGARRAMAAVFLFSGVLHDIAISLPARAGYGLPTLYFILQALGVELERSSLGRRCRLRSGVRGWLFAATLIFGPVALLFHPPFVKHVVIPFIQVLGG